MGPTENPNRMISVFMLLTVEDYAPRGKPFSADDLLDAPGGKSFPADDLLHALDGKSFPGTDQPKHAQTKTTMAREPPTLSNKINKPLWKKCFWH